MTKKPDLIEKLLTRFLGIGGVFDEYHQKIAYKNAGKAYLILTYYLMFATLIYILFSDFLPTYAGLIYAGLNMLVSIFIIPLGLKMALDKADIDTSGSIEVPEEALETTRKKTIKRGIWIGVIFTLFMILQNGLSFMKNGHSFWDVFTKPIALIFLLIGGGIFGTLMTLIAYHNIDKEK